MPTASRSPWLRASAALLISVLFAVPTAFAQDLEVEAPEGVLWQTAPDTPFLFTRFDAEWSRTTKKIYFLGGRLADGTTDGSIWSFDPVTGAYTDTTVDMPVPVSNYNIAALVDGSGNEILMTFGGRPAAGGVTSVVQGYFPGTNTTTTFALDPYPVLTAPGGAAVVDNIAYSFGGFDAVAVIDDTYLFDITAPAGSRWTTGPNLNLARSYIGVAILDGYIYAIGGATFVTPNLFASAVVERLDSSNPVAWDDAGVADLPVACDEAQAHGFDTGSIWHNLDGNAILAGCGQWPMEIVESQSYQVNTWNQAFPDLNLSRRNHAGALVPVGGIVSTRPAYWVWGGRFTADTTLRATPEFFVVTPDQVIFADGFNTGDTISWSDTVP